MSAGSLRRAVDALYQSVVEEPDRWGDAAFADWIDSLVDGGASIGRADAREVRAAMRNAAKLRDFWSAAPSQRRTAAPDWESRVDVAVGPAAWRPTLELALRSLDDDGSEESFDVVGERFRLVHNTPWMDGLTYEEWSTG